MGLFKNIEIDIIEMYFTDGLREQEIAKIVGLAIEEVQEIISDFEQREMDYASELE